MTWTMLTDRNAGGDLRRPPIEVIFVEANVTTTFEALQHGFDVWMYDHTCDCCGADYDVKTGDDLARMTWFKRGCTLVNGHVAEYGTQWCEYIPLDEYLARPTVHVVRADEVARILAKAGEVKP